jgi:hypothetical protein
MTESARVTSLSSPLVLHRGLNSPPFFSTMSPPIFRRDAPMSRSDSWIRMRAVGR